MRLAQWMGLGVALLAGTGCHAKFHKYAPTIGAVRPEVIDAGAPTVMIGSSGSAVVDAVNGVRAVDVAGKISRQVDIAETDAAFVDGLVETLGAGPPFGTTDKKSAPVLQVEMTNYGLYIPVPGGPGDLVYDLRVRIYMPDGERVYSTSLRCETPVAGASALSQITGTRDNVGNVLDMRKREIQAAFDAAGDECGRELTTLMRKHAD